MERICSAALLVLLSAGCSSNHTPDQLVAGLGEGGGVVSLALLEAHQEPEFRAAVLRGMAHADPAVRWHCVRLAERWKDITVVDALLPLLRDPALKVRAQGARSLCALLDNSEILAMLRDSEMPVVARAALASALLRDPLALAEPGLLDWLLRPDHPANLRVYFLEALAASCHQCVSEDPGDAGVRQEVLQARERLGALALQLWEDTSQDQELRCAAMGTYAGVAGRGAYAPLLASAGSAGQARLREAALQNLGCLHDGRATTYLLQVMNDRTQPLSVRNAALLGLAPAVAEPEVLKRTVASLRDPDPRMRDKVAWLLTRAPQAEAALLEAKNQELSPMVEAQMLRALTSMKPCPAAAPCVP